MPTPDCSIKREFVATNINQLWVADMTYVPTWAGFLYLAVVTDVFSRKVVGWAFGARMTADLVLSALNIAILKCKPESVIHHSDQGSQYTATVFGKRCAEKGVRPSMGSVGDAYDNANNANQPAANEYGLPTGCCAPVDKPAPEHATASNYRESIRTKLVENNPEVTNL